MRIVVEQSQKVGMPPRERAELVLDYVQVGELYETYEARIAAVTRALEPLLAIEDPSVDDRLLIARLRQWEAYLIYSGSESGVERVRAIIAAGLETLEGIGPCAERASLLHRLGWVAWRAGPVSEARPALEAALKEARAAGSARFERWALHDLGLARTRGTPDPEGLGMMEKSMELAREANDVPLLMRSYINLGAMRMAFDDRPSAIALWEEGLTRARRSGDRHSVFWIANNLAQTLSEVGRLTDALPLHRAAIEAAAAIGLLRAGVPEYAWTLLHLGRIDEARAAWEDAREAEGTPEPQMIGIWRVMNALLSWGTDPQASVAGLRRAIDAAAAAAAEDQVLYVSGPLARMALRISDDDALQIAVEGIESAVANWPTASTSAQAARVAALRDAGPATAAARLAEAAERLRGLGRSLEAAEAYADAALLAARANQANDEWADRAAALYAECSAVPVLDILQASARQKSV